MPQDRDTARAEPQAGGSYIVNADGSLTLVQQTAEGLRRASGKAAEAPAPATPAATPAPDRSAE